MDNESVVQPMMLHVLIKIAIGYRRHYSVLAIWQHGQFERKLASEFLPLLYRARRFVGKGEGILPK
jgi:hypothetical protein